MERQRPHADAVVQIGFLEALGAAPAQVEGVAEDARMGEQARQQRRQQCHAGEADEEDAPARRQVEIDVQVLDEFGPGRLVLAGDGALRIGVQPEVAAFGVDVDEKVRHEFLRRHQIDMLDMFGARNPGLQRALYGFRPHGLDHRRVRLLPAVEFADQHRRRAGEADQIDQRGEGEPERGMPGQHGAHEARGDPHPDRLGAHERPFRIESEKLTTARPESTAVARSRRLSDSVHAMQPAQNTGTSRPPMTRRVCVSPGL